MKGISLPLAAHIDVKSNVWHWYCDVISTVLGFCHFSRVEDWPCARMTKLPICTGHWAQKGGTPYTHLQLQSTCIIKQNNYLWVCLACGCLLFYKATSLRSPPHPGSLLNMQHHVGWQTVGNPQMSTPVVGLEESWRLWPVMVLVLATTKQMEWRVLRRWLADRLILKGCPLLGKLNPVRKRLSWFCRRLPIRWATRTPTLQFHFVCAERTRDFCVSVTSWLRP